MRLSFALGDEKCAVQVDKSAAGYRVQFQGHDYGVEVMYAGDGNVAYMIDGVVHEAQWASDGSRLWLFLNGKTYVFGPGDDRHKSNGPTTDRLGGGEKEIRTPMPGHIRSIQCVQGEPVVKGQICFVLEAMKMEIRIHAPTVGRLDKLLTSAGASVERDQLLATIE